MTSRSNVPTPEYAAAQIEQFIRRRHRIAPDDPWFSRKVNIWEEGYLDSLGAVELIDFLERTFATRIEDDVLFSPQFASIDGISALVVASLDARAPLPLEPRKQRVAAMKEVEDPRIM